MNIIRIAAAGLLIILTPLAGARAQSMSATYFTVGEQDQDANRLAGGVFNNMVQSGLGPNGLPVLNTAAFGCVSGCFTATPLPLDVTAGGELTYWSPALNTGGAGGVSDVIQTGTGTIVLPYSNGSFYPPNGGGGDDSSGFQTAIFASTLSVPSAETISFNIGADDFGFVYLDGQNVCDLGGIHGNSPGTCTTATVGSGDHTLKVFFADLENTGSALTFGITTADVTSSAVPEPASLGLLGAGLAGLGLIRRRRHQG